MELLKELTQAWGVAGREKAVRAIIRREITGYADEVFSFKNVWDTFFLNGCTLVEAHVIERIEQVVVEVEIGEVHFFD